MKLLPFLQAYASNEDKTTNQDIQKKSIQTENDILHTTHDSIWLEFADEDWFSFFLGVVFKN